MIDTVVVQPAHDTAEASGAGVSWAAVIAGAVVAFALTLVLITFGTGLGLSMASPWSGAGASASTFKISTGIYLVVMAMISSSIGGYLAGRLRSRWVGVHSDEVYFRDTAHGFIAWALASVVGALLLTSAASSVIGGGASAVTQGATAAASHASGPMDGYIDTLLRPNSPPAQAAANSETGRGELSRLFVSSFANGGTLKPDDQTYIAKVVAARTGLSEADATARVNQVVTQVKTSIDTARKASAELAFWLTASLLIGAFCASLAATEGGGLRDGTWGRKGRADPRSR